MKKRCTKCGTSKILSEFAEDKRTKSGRYSACRECYGKAIRPLTPEQKRRHRVDYNRRNPKKTAARCKLNQALWLGKMERGSCFHCGTRENLEGHHIFYELPLKVLWLCRSHHNLFHRIWKENKITPTP